MSLILWIMIVSAAALHVGIGIYLALDYDADDQPTPRETAEEARVAIIVADYLRAMNEERYEYLQEVWDSAPNVPGLEAALHDLHEGLAKEVTA